MTTFEHSLVGIHFAFATGMHRFVGWRGVAIAGVASNLPDWDGIPMLFDMQRFEKGHRVWGHNVLSIALISLMLGYTQGLWDWLGRIAHWMQRRTKEVSVEFLQQPDWMRGMAGFWVFFAISMFAQMLHLPCDMVVSGGKGLSDWEVQPWWPFSSASFVYPLIPWGDVGPTVILMAGLIAIAKVKSHVSKLAWLTIGLLCGYLILRGAL